MYFILMNLVIIYLHRMLPIQLKKSAKLRYLVNVRFNKNFIHLN